MLLGTAAAGVALRREMVCTHKKVGAKKPSMVSSSPSCHVLYRVEAAVSGCKKGKRFGAYLWHLCYKCMGLYTHCTMRVFIIRAQLLFLCNGRYAAFIRISLLASKYPSISQLYLFTCTSMELSVPLSSKSILFVCLKIILCLIDHIFHINYSLIKNTCQITHEKDSF